MTNSDEQGTILGETYGETWWRVYIAAHHYGGFSPWGELAHENQVAIEAASQAVGARVLRALECAEDAYHPEGCDCQFCREDERQERARMDREEADDDELYAGFEDDGPVDDGLPRVPLAGGITSEFDQ